MHETPDVPASEDPDISRSPEAACELMFGAFVEGIGWRP